ncbi:tetratricopeptide repeat protein [Stenoxybacter acetivorans]|uniref:tetratricopeptide repeat protein n=1 Tax=Stenoxybacter acetivorans TaxID=422441 RepID=UPI00056455A5|nr:tetratricopeptide repeat protein [Stenoxybacter acetivorans]
MTHRIFYTKANILLSAAVSLLAVAFPVQAVAASSDSAATIPAAETVSPISSNPLVQQAQQEWQQRAAAANRAGEMFTLFSAELALDKNEPQTALAIYSVLFQRTHAPELGLRTIELIFSDDNLTLQKALAQAQQLMQSWQTWQPKPGVEQKKAQWLIDAAAGNVDAVVKNADSILASADDVEVKRVFLQLAQMSLRYPEKTAKFSESIHRLANAYPEQPEAVVSDALASSFSTLYDKQSNHHHHQDAVLALRRLLELDPDIAPPTGVTLGLIQNKTPDVLSAFFKQTDLTQLPLAWKKVYVGTQIKSNNVQGLYQQLQPLLQNNTNPEWLIMAAALLFKPGEPIDTGLLYLENAYLSGSPEQKNKAAVSAIAQLVEVKNFQAARSWLKRLDARQQRFDYLLMLALIQNGEGAKWQEIQSLLDEAARINPQGQVLGRKFLIELQQILLNTWQNDTVHTVLNRLISEAQNRKNNDELSLWLYQRGLLYADKLNQPQKAIADFRRFLSLNPGNPNGMNALGYTLLLQPKSGKEHAVNFQEATQLIEAAYAIEPQAAPINDSLGWAYFLNGDAKKALPYLRFAFSKMPNSEVAAHLGEVLWTLNQQEEAKQVWQQGLQLNDKDAVLLNTLKRFNVQRNTE